MRHLPLLASLLLAAPAYAASYKVDPSASLIGVVTHKAGIASAAAHNHLAVAQDYQLTLRAEGTDLEQAFADLSFESAKLSVDDPATNKTWYSLIKDLAILDEPFSEPSEGDRADIRKSMLGSDQLDAAKYKTITASIVSLKKQPGKRGKIAFTHVAELALTIHGKTMHINLPAQVALAGGKLDVTASATAKFSDFGIEPFSAFLGAVKVEDEFDLVLRLVAQAG